jgi:leukotriene-A4 hydrolase
MARIHKDDRFLDFDALGGYIALRATVESNMPEDFTKLVLEIGDGDPDETYSRVAYEKGFNLLYALEKRVGKDKFEAFFQAYVKKYAKQILTSEDFRDFFMEYFAGNKAVVDFDWHTWLYVPGMPLEEPSFDRSLSAAAEKLAADWYKVDQEGGDLPDHDTSSWSSAMLTCFMDNLVSLAGSTPLKMSTVHDLHTTYNFGGTLNAEILFRYSMMAIAAEDESMIAVILHFTTSQGRMKYTRPLYRALFASRWRPVAVAAFLQKQSSYHPICAKMIANDLKASEPPSEAVSPLATSKKWLAWAAGGVALAVAAGFLLSKLPKR